MEDRSNGRARTEVELNPIGHFETLPDGTIIPLLGPPPEEPPMT